MKRLFIIITLLSYLYTQAQNQSKVLLIGMDGCRADALQLANTPNLNKLIATGYSCMRARTVVPTMSGPGWASMLTGVWYHKHKVNGNLFIGNKLQDFTHFYNLVEAHDSSLYTLSISHWEPINEKIIGLVDYKKSPKTDEVVAEDAIRVLETENPDVLFLHFDDIDHVGHFTGFGPQNPRYIESIEQVDALIGKVLTALNSRKTIEKEDWLILFSPDHGGIFNNHGGGTEVERNTFMIAYNKNKAAYKATPKIDTLVGKNLVHFNKPQHQLVIAPLDKKEEQAWAFEFNFNIQEWKADAFLLNAPNLTIKTHPNDGHTWFVFVDNKKIKIQGDSINNQNWHQIRVQCSNEGVVQVFQNGQIVGLEQSKNPIKNILSDSIIFHNNEITKKKKKEKNLDWLLQDCKLWSNELSNPRRLAWAEETPPTPTLIFQWQNTSLKKSATNKAVIIEKKEPIFFKNYSHFPVMVDITPTILEHLGIKLLPQQKRDYFDGCPIEWK